MDYSSIFIKKLTFKEIFGLSLTFIHDKPMLVLLFSAANLLTTGVFRIFQTQIDLNFRAISWFSVLVSLFFYNFFMLKIYDHITGTATNNLDLF